MDLARQHEVLNKLIPFIRTLSHLATGTYTIKDHLYSWFYTELIPIKRAPYRLHQLSTFIDQEDLEQELTCWCLEKLRDFQQRHLRPESYLKKYLPWKLRDYLLTQIASVERHLNIDELPTEEIRIDLSSLTPYEQYIIYLYYWDNLTTSEISDKLFRDRRLISEDIKKSVNALKENYL